MVSKLFNENVTFIFIILVILDIAEIKQKIFLK